jgi:hypothetical protein
MYVLHKQNAIITHHRTGKEARMGKNTHHSPKNVFPIDTIHNIKKERNTQTKEKPGHKRGTANTTNTEQKKWIIFTYHSPLIRKVTNLFKNTTIHIAFRANNTMYQQLEQKADNMNPSGVYEIKCNTRSKNYVGQSGRPITIRHKEHIRYIKTNNLASAYTTHILNNRHGYGTANDTLKLIQACRKSMKMNHRECMYIQI